MLLFVFQVLLLAGMVAAAFYLLHRYATYGREASVNTVQQSSEENSEIQEEESDQEAYDKEDRKQNTILKKLECEETIRVQILGDDYLDKYHQILTVSADDDMMVGYQGERQILPAGGVLRVSQKSESEDSSQTEPVFDSEGDISDAEETVESKIENVMEDAEEDNTVESATEETEEDNAAETVIEDAEEDNTVESAAEDTTENVIEAMETSGNLSEENREQEIILARDQMLTIETVNGKPLILPELKRGQSAPAYSGKLQIYWTDAGLLAVNEVDLETYLNSVVSSEMPSRYPLQALCAQAICARTYAVNCMKRAATQDSLMDLDDSVSYQVYNNYPGDDRSKQAVEMTKGIVLDQNEVFYYSTSCQTDGRKDLADEESFREFLDIRPGENAEYSSPWVRWETEIPAEHILERLKELYQCEWKKLAHVEVLERSLEGQVQKAVFSDGTEEIIVEGEYQFRNVLNAAKCAVRLRDDSEVTGIQLLPSAFCYLREILEEESEDRKILALKVFGGGYGHGIGMSQNGAAAMAEEGAGYEEILSFYFGTSYD